MHLNYERANGDGAAAIASPPATVGTVMTVAPGELARGVLSRVISALADARRLLDRPAFGHGAARRRGVRPRRVGVRGRRRGLEILDGDGRLDVRIGPLVEGGSDRILEALELPGGASLRKLANEVEVKRGGGEQEYLRVVIDR